MLKMMTIILKGMKKKSDTLYWQLTIIPGSYEPAPSENNVYQNTLLKVLIQTCFSFLYLTCLIRVDKEKTSFSGSPNFVTRLAWTLYFCGCDLDGNCKVYGTYWQKDPEQAEAAG